MLINICFINNSKNTLKIHKERKLNKNVKQLNQWIGIVMEVIWLHQVILQLKFGLLMEIILRDRLI